MDLACLLSDMLAAGAGLDAVKAVVEAAKRQNEARDEKRRDLTAARVRKHREIKRGGKGDVTPVTPVTRYPPPPSSLSPLETPNPPTPAPVVIPPQPSAEAPRGKRAVRGTLLPDDFEPLDRQFAKAAEHGLPAGWVHERADAMREWAKANANHAKARKADWHATLDGFIRRDLPKARTGPPPGRPSPPRNPRLDAANDLSAYFAEHRP